MSNGEYDRKIPANDKTSIDVVGNFIFLKSSNLTVRVLVEGRSVTMVEGDYQRVEEGFKNFDILNENGTQANVTLVVGKGEFGRRQVTGDVGITAGENLVTAADVSCLATAVTQVLASNTDRQTSWIHNLDATTTLRVGDSNAGASRGIPLPPGATAIISSNNAAVHAYNPSGSAVSVAVMEQRK